MCALACGATGAAQAQAQPPATDITEFLIERADGDLLLSAQVKFELTALVEDALLKGVPLFFVAEAEILRERWYWTDQKVANEWRHMRLAYQPLTRRWRLNIGPRPLGNVGVGVTLAQTFDSLPEALASVQRISRWRIAHLADLDNDTTYLLRFRFALDVSQLPRPLQIGAVGQADWSVSASRSVRVGPEGIK